jgi:FtsP/CotA-like multicopper oxidase with cupredoxin domain
MWLSRYRTGCGISSGAGPGKKAQNFSRGALRNSRRLREPRIRHAWDGSWHGDGHIRRRIAGWDLWVCADHAVWTDRDTGNREGNSASLVEPAAANLERAVRRREFLLDSGICGGQRPTEMGMLPGLCINGKTHDLARIDVETELGTLEVWKIVSRGMAHPFHVHGASFRILSLSGTLPPAHLAGWKDVVLVEDEAELLVAFNRPATREHPFMYHCHILEHEDAGMMGQYVCAWRVAAVGCTNDGKLAVN